MEVGYRRKIEDARSGMVTLGPEESFCPKCFGDMKVQKTRPRYIATIKYGCIDLRILTLVLIFILDWLKLSDYFEQFMEFSH